jgi:hypothetical protein
MRHILIALTAALLLGCDREPVTSLDDERFIEVVVELRRAAVQHYDDTDAFAARRAEIFRAADTDEAEVRHFVEVHSRDMQRMADLWAVINRRLSEETEGGDLQ